MNRVDYNQIELELAEKLKTMADRPVTKWPNVGLQAAPLPRLEVKYFFNDPDTFSTGGKAKHMGFYQVDVCTQLNEGTGQSRELTNQIALLFAPYQDLGSVRIREQPTVEAGEEMDGKWIASVTIPFEAL